MSASSRNARSAAPGAQDLVELLDQPRRRAPGDLRRIAANRINDRWIDRELEPRGKHDRAEHPHRVFAEAHVRIADAPDDACVQVVDAADVVDDREGRDVVEQRVDREVAAERVLFGRAERVVAVDQVIAIRRVARPPRRCGWQRVRRRRWPDSCSIRCPAHRRAVPRAARLFGHRLELRLAHLPAERRHLDRLLPELDVRETEAAADDPAVAEEALDLVRVGRRADVEVLGAAAEQQVPDAAADEVGDVVELPQPVEDFEGVWIDVLARERVLRAWDDPGRDHCREL